MHSPCREKKGQGMEDDDRGGEEGLISCSSSSPPPFPSSSFVLCLLPLCCILPPSILRPVTSKFGGETASFLAAQRTRRTRGVVKGSLFGKRSPILRGCTLSLLLSSDQVEFPLWAASNGGCVGGGLIGGGLLFLPQGGPYQFVIALKRCTIF